MRMRKVSDNNPAPANSPIAAIASPFSLLLDNNAINAIRPNTRAVMPKVMPNICQSMNIAKEESIIPMNTEYSIAGTKTLCFPLTATIGTTNESTSKAITETINKTIKTIALVACILVATSVPASFNKTAPKYAPNPKAIAAVINKPMNI